MKLTPPLKAAFTLAALVITVIACNKWVSGDFRKTYTDTNALLHSDSLGISFFKAHLQDGRVAILEEDWLLNATQDSVQGLGQLYSINRVLEEQGSIHIAIDDIAIIETNQLKKIQAKDGERLAALAIVTGLSIAITIACLTNPKACFGSCPTFYTPDARSVHDARAEGFSSSISPALQRTDIDALQCEQPAGTFQLIMKNEAMETHVLDQIRLHAAPKAPGTFVFQTQSAGYKLGDAPRPPQRASVNGQIITPALHSIDRQEYYARTDSFDLTAKEDLILEFENTAARQNGLVINFRQSLLTTFLLYSGLSYMGADFCDYFYMLETSKQAPDLMARPFRKIGGIEVWAWDGRRKDWQFIEELYETGPIAHNKMLVSLPNLPPSEDGSIRVKLRMAKGNWRLDYAGLTALQGTITPLELSPERLCVVSGNTQELSLVAQEDGASLISFPGNEYQFDFELPALPEGHRYELFLSSTGYYLEWMRKEWIQEENPSKLRKFLAGHPGTWREMALEYKSTEATAEEAFWASQYSPLQ